MIITNLDKHPCPVCGYIFEIEDIDPDPEYLENDINCPECAAFMSITLDFVLSGVAIITEIDLDLYCPGCSKDFEKGTGSYRTDLIPACKHMRCPVPFWTIEWICDECISNGMHHWK